MDVYNVPEHGYSDAYLIQGTELNPHLTSPFLEPFEAMYNEGAPEFVVDQGMYYPTATNYGYMYTGLESPGEWDDHHRVFGVDGQDIQFAGAQTDNLQYVYYTPSYGYSQSPYNPYNPYIPGAMMGVDGPFMGVQQYYIPYDNTASSPAYYPMVQASDVTSNGTTDSFVDITAASRSDGLGFRRNSAAANHGRGAPNHSISFQRASDGFRANGGSSKLPATNGNVASGSFSTTASTQVFQGRGAQSIDDHGKALSNRNQLKVAVPAANGLSNLGPSAHGRVTVEKVRPKLHFDRVVNDVNGSPDGSTEQNQGPRTNKSKNQLAVKAYTNRAGKSDAQGNIIIYTDQYNQDDFPVDYGNAKFFVIKSYSEDDVHKSIKYNVWSSTPNGNKKLNSAFEDAQKIASGEPGGCPIFLFFSVNASGQFCGVAEMTGPVDFHRDMDFWQQDKWSGSFPVKWHIVKDVPNPNFRHIILENNEHKPVTNSRDTQEIRFKKGVEMLRVFKNYTSNTSLLDDFMYYENRQRILQEEKARMLIKSYGTPLFVPMAMLDPPRKLNSLLDFPSSGERKSILQKDSNTSDGSSTARKEQVLSDAVNSKSNITDDKAKEVADVKPTENELKIGSLSINPKPGEPNSVGGDTAATEPSNPKIVDVVTVGSMPVKVKLNGLTKPSGVLTVGTIPLDPRALQVERKGVTVSFPKASSPKV